MFSSDSDQGVVDPSSTVLRAAGASVRKPANGLRLAEATGRSRQALERFIASRFLEVYDARIHHFLPRLFGAYDADGALTAAFGLRGADRESLFLEQYLDAPIETFARGRFGTHAKRAQIAEVGNLAGATAGALRALIPALTPHLASQGYAYVAFTGSARLCNGFSRLGLPLSVLAPAPLERLPPAERARWGRYYEHAPAVMIGDVAEGMRLLAAMSGNPSQLSAALAPLAGVGAP